MDRKSVLNAALAAAIATVGAGAATAQPQASHENHALTQNMSVLSQAKQSVKDTNNMNPVIKSALTDENKTLSWIQAGFSRAVA